MALFSATLAATPNFNVRAVEAGDAAEMVTRLQAQVAAALAAGETKIVDFNLAGAGSGPQWQGWLTTANQVSGGVITVAPQNAGFVAAVAGNPVEAVLLLKQRLAPFVSDLVCKVEVAGAGDGPTYMAVALLDLD
jgi:hypothetical protein